MSKHGNDVFRLSQLLTADSLISLEARIAEDLRRFLGSIAADGSNDPKAIKIDVTSSDIIDRIKRAYLL